MNLLGIIISFPFTNLNAMNAPNALNEFNTLNE
jgi:hypothetical protein